MSTIDETVAGLMGLATEYAMAMEENCKYRCASFTQVAEYRARQELETALRLALSQSGQDAQDAARYRWLRAQHWEQNTLAVVLRPKDNTKLGCFLPFDILLDQAIEAAIQSKGKHD